MQQGLAISGVNLDSSNHVCISGYVFAAGAICLSLRLSGTTPVLDSKDVLPASVVPAGRKEVPAGTATVMVERLFFPHC